jgi:hypothetical protein
MPSSYCLRSLLVAFRALIIRIRLARWQCDTKTTCCLPVRPIVISRSSCVEWSGSENVRAHGSRKTDAASSKETACLRKLLLAFASSHSKITAPVYLIEQRGTRLSGGLRVVDRAQQDPATEAPGIGARPTAMAACDIESQKRLQSGCPTSCARPRATYLGGFSGVKLFRRCNAPAASKSLA